MVARPVVAIGQDSHPPADTVPTPIRWWHGAIVLGGLSALMLVDEPMHRFVQDQRSSTTDDFAHAVRHFGQVEVYGTVTAGMVATGLITHNDELTRAGARLAATLALAGATTTAAKLSFGRPRPSESSDADIFKPFSGDDAMPSGHSTMAFALAAALADDIHNTAATIGLYTLAGGVAWSRLNDDRHWLSDVVAGGVVGIASAKLMNGRWRVFNLHPPRILLGPHHAGIVWQVPF